VEEEHVMRVQVSAAEYAAHQLDEVTLRSAVEAIETDGFVVLGSVVDSGVLDALKAKLDEDTAELLRRGAWGGAGKLPGHLQQAMPRSGRYIYRDIVTNPLIIQVSHAVLGDGIHNRSYNGNTNVPGSHRQPLHRDGEHLWPNLVHPTVTLIINISPIDVDETNAATEVWPGTHQILGPTRISEDDEERRRAVVRPVQAITRKGDAVLRDIRLWHRGVPNTSNAVRHMIAMSHSTRWYARGEPIRVTADAVPKFTDDVLSTPVEVVGDDYDYLSHRFG
jgi:hypothetical protein